MVERIPRGLIPASGSLVFTEDTIPDALLREHALAQGRWGVLHVFEGSLEFLDLITGETRTVLASDLVIIRPGAPHRVAVAGHVSCRIDFFREPDAGPPTSTPGEFADQAVRASLERCEANGDFGETFYGIFLNSSSEIAGYFAASDLHRQRAVLRDSVHQLVTKDVSDPELREMLEQLGRTHSRGCRNVPPRLYELWLDCVCLTGQQLDPEWNKDLERKWRVRLRAGMQIIMSSY